MIRILQLNKTALVGFAVFVLLLVRLPLIDPDYFWHLKTGEYIVSHAALPSGDVFSYTQAGHPWVLHEWLFEVLLYAVSAGFGTTGVRALVAALIVTAVALSFTTARRLAGAATAWPPLMIGTCAFAVAMAPRPQLLTYVCFALYLAVLLRFKYEHAVKPLIVLPLIMVVWVNAHAAYAVGIALLLLFTACEWIVWVSGSVRDPARKQRLVRLTQAVCLAVLASLANPGLFERWLYPLQVVGMEVNRLIQEWQSPDFHEPASQAYLLLVLMFFVAGAYNSRKPDLTEMALPLVFIVAGYISKRHIPLAVLVLVPFTALGLARGPSAAVKAFVSGLKPVRWYMARRSTGRELGNYEYGLNWLAACTIALCLPAYVHGDEMQAGGQPAEVKAKGAVDFIVARGLGGNLLNEYGDGGYLIYRLAPHAKVAVDGRADMYGDKFIMEYLQVYQGAADWQAKFERLGVDLAVLPLDAPIRQLLLGNGRFRELYRDKHYSVLQPAAAPAPLRVAGRHALKAGDGEHALLD